MYKKLGKKVPFRVKRLHLIPPGKDLSDFRNTKRKVFVVEKVQLQWKYGVAWGYFMYDGVRDDNYVKSMYPEADGCIPCAGCGGWILIDEEDLALVSSRIPVVGPDYILSFGKYKGLTIKEIHKINPSYIQWLIDEEKIKFI